MQRDDHRVGLIRLLTIALRVVTVLEGVVRSALAEQCQQIAGLFAGNPKRRTAQPTTERLLEAFNEITVWLWVCTTASPSSLCAATADFSPLWLFSRRLYSINR
ncbi:MAG: hypothetical protein JO202_07150 [Ktedonobacteraceae bacterium]|nr:hypothetical protein [Ktedonobacteraceae bacterium]